MHSASLLLVFLLAANTISATTGSPVNTPAPGISYSSLSVFPAPPPTPDVLIPCTLNQEGLEKISRKIVDNLVNQRFENVRDDFAEDLRSALPAEKIQEVWESVVLQIGEFEEISSTQNRTAGGYQQVNHKCKFERNNANIEVTFSSDKKVVGLYIKP